MLQSLYKYFNVEHPECMPREMFVGNTLSIDPHYMNWKRPRFGRHAYDVYGNEITDQGFRPVFVLKLEVLRRTKFK